jgi:hypothetical protein
MNTKRYVLRSTARKSDITPHRVVYALCGSIPDVAQRETNQPDNPAHKEEHI